MEPKDLDLLVFMSAVTLNFQNRAAKTETASGSVRYAVFKRQKQFFGLTIDLVREVISGQTLTRVARSQEQILGVLSLRGEILPVVVIDNWLGLETIPDDPIQPILVLRRADLLVGLRVDAIQSVAGVPADQVQAHPAAGNGGLLKGIWHPAGHAPITLINDTVLVEMLCQSTSVNL